MSFSSLLGGIVGGIIGFVTGGPAGAVKGFIYGYTIGNALSPPLGPDQIGPRLDDLSVQTSSSTADLPRAYGTIAMYGNMIWAKGNALEEVSNLSTQKRKFLGFTNSTQNTTVFTYYLTCAVAFAKIPAGADLKVLKIWIGDKLCYNVTNEDVGTILASGDFANQITIHPGTDDQAVDPLIAADVGADNASAYPGIFYITFDSIDLSGFLNSVSRAEIKVEFSVSASGVFSGIDLIDEIPVPVNAPYYDLFNANYQDSDGLHVWNVDFQDAGGGHSILYIQHFIALPNSGMFLKQKFVGNQVVITSDTNIYEYLTTPAKGKANTNTQVFVMTFTRTGGGGGGGGSPGLKAGAVTWEGGIGGACNDVPTAYPNFAKAIEILTDPSNPHHCPGSSYTSEYVFDGGNQADIPGGVAWGDNWATDPNPATYRFQIIYSGPYNYKPYPITSGDFTGPSDTYITVTIIKPGYTGSVNVDINEFETLPEPGTHFSSFDEHLFIACIFGGVSGYRTALWKLGSSGFFDSAVLEKRIFSLSIVRMGVVNSELYVVGENSGVAELRIYDLDLATVVVKNSSDIAALFGTTGAEFYENVSFDFDRFLYLISGDLYEKYSLTDTPRLVGDVSANLIDGSEAPVFFDMWRHTNMLTVSTFGGSLPFTGVQFFTISVVADIGSIPLAEIIGQECGIAGLSPSDIDVSLIDQDVTGYRISQRGSIRNVLQQLQACYPFDVIQSGYKLKFVPRGKSSIATVDYADLGPDVQWTQDREMSSQLPRKVILKYLDRAQEYETAEQYSERPLNSSNETVIEIPIVFTADEAAKIVDVLHSLYLVERKTFADFSLPPMYRGLEPSDVITVTTQNAIYEVRLTSIQYTQEGKLICQAKPNAVTIYTSNASGESPAPAVETIPLAGAAITVLLDTPVIYIEDAPGITAVMASVYDNWTGGILWKTTDGGNTWITLAIL